MLFTTFKANLTKWSWRLTETRKIETNRTLELVIIKVTTVKCWLCFKETIVQDFYIPIYGKN